MIELAQWCHRFSPSAGLEESETPETLFLDATNLAPLYGGEEEFIAQVARGMRRRGLEARLALAETVSAAWGLARYGEPDHDGELDALPLEALRLPEDLLATLQHLGIACVGDAFGLPRDQLRSRFGSSLLQRIDQLTGATPEVIIAVDPPEEFVVEQAFEHPLTRSDAIAFSLARLFERLAWLLAARNAGALAVACRFECEGAPAAQFEFGLFQGTACARHLMELAELQMERVRLPGPAEAIELRVVRHAPLEQRQGVLFDEEHGLARSRPLAALVDRLAGRLGKAAVMRCRLGSDAQPELAYRDEPLVGADRPGSQRLATPKRLKARATPRAKKTPDVRALDRPLCLLAQPAALEASSVFPEGPPVTFRRGGEWHKVARHWGPERIETGWWRKQRAWRDYYRVETSEGRRFWLFRRLRDDRWFLHGVYE